MSGRLIIRFAIPEREIFSADALPWIEVHGKMPRFAKRTG